MATKKSAESPSLPVMVGGIERRIYTVRESQVMLDSELAVLYGVQTKVFNQAVKRHRKRFPSDFMFQLTTEEAGDLRSQLVTSKLPRGGRRYAPYVFTEQGVAMLSSILNSEQAIEVNIAIMRAFVKLREMLAAHHDLAQKLAEMEKKYDAKFRVVFDAIRKMMEPPAIPNKRPIGFKTDVKN